MVNRAFAGLRDWSAYFFSWTLRSWVRDSRSEEFHRHHEIAMHEVVDACEQARAPYWFIEGTLIALLRHGRNHIPGLARPVDDDIDVMFECATHADWLELAARLRATLLERGWHDGGSGGSLMSTSSRPGARTDKLKLRRFAPGLSRVWTHVDFHSCLIAPGADYATNHDRVDEYPFQHWGGRVPLTLLHPWQSCECYGRSVPCPQDPIALLCHWHGGEYARSSLAYPPRAVSVEEKKLIEAGIRSLHARGFASFAPLLTSVEDA